jgi:glycosyltransferase involved in cell wall biosynthesis
MIFDLIIPCFNPATGWEKPFVSHLQKLKIEISKTSFLRFQVFLINDGSVQNFRSKEIKFLQKAGLPVRIINNSKNYGKGYSLRKGIELADSPYSVYTDLDFPFGTESIVEILRNLEKGYDVVLGARSSSEYYRQATLGRQIMSKTLMLVNRHLLRLPFEDTQAGIKGFNQTGKNIFLSTTINRFLFDLEFVKTACSFPDIRIQSISVSNSESLMLSSFGFKTILIELFNFIRILVKHNYVSGAKKNLTWDRLGGI